jgi:diaminopimelate decarboxylase
LQPLDHTICYAVKACSNLAILRLLIKEGASFDIVSGGELFRVLKAKGPARSCTFAGVGTTEEEIALALHDQTLQRQRAGLAHQRDRRTAEKKAGGPFRVNPDVDARTQIHLDRKERNKFGIGLDPQKAYIRAPRSFPPRFARCADYIGSQILSRPFAEAASLVPLVDPARSIRHRLF